MLTQEIERQATALIQEARILLGEALRLDPTVEVLDVDQMIARLEALRTRAARLRMMSTAVRTNVVTLRCRRRARAGSR